MAVPLLLLLLAAFYAYAAAATLWTYSIVRKAQPGLQRLLLGLPVVVLNLMLPAMLDYKEVPVLVTPLGGLFSLSAFKVLALCIGRGPLLLPLGPLQFCAVLFLPLVPSSVFATSGGDRSLSVKDQRYLLREYGTQMGIAVLVSWVLMIPGIHGFVRHWLYTLASCSFLAAVFDMLGAGASLLLGMEIAPTFNKPWLSSSFADFWARRWNLVTTYMMRVLVYEPVISGRLVPLPAPVAAATPPSPRGSGDNGGGQLSNALPSEVAAVGECDAGGGVKLPPPALLARRPTALRRFLALQATFLVSGLWHILVFWYNTRVFSWRWCAFFAVQAPILMVERQLQRWAGRRGICLPWAVQVFLTNFLLIAIANPLFFGPTDDTRFATRNLEAGQQLLVGLLTRLDAAVPGWRDWVGRVDPRTLLAAALGR